MTPDQPAGSTRSFRGPAAGSGRRPPVDRQARLHALTVRLVAVVPRMTEVDARRHLDALAGTVSARLAWLDDHLTAYPDALRSGSSDAPAVFIRFAYTLHQAGYAVVVPACVDCEQVAAALPQRVEGGRVCARCARRRQAKECGRCGRRNPVRVHDSDGTPVCQNCWNRDPASWQTCTSCGYPGTVAARPNRKPICRRCYETPRVICARCSRSAVEAARTDAGEPLCAACRPAPRCGLCGREGRLKVRARDGRPGLCEACYRRTLFGVCDACGLIGKLATTGTQGGPRLCTRCRPVATRRCSRCGRDRRIIATWPIGSVCASCYAWTRRHPAVCLRCQGTQVLVGLDQQGQRICGPCAGLDIDYTCPACGRAGFVPRDGRCERCLAAHRAEELLTGTNGVIRAELRPLATALANTEAPDAILTWLRPGGPAEQLFRHLTEADAPASHELLDSWPQTLALHRFRQILVHVGVLPDRADYLERLGPWLDELLATRPAADGPLIHAWAHWAVLRRARHRLPVRPFTPHAAGWARTRIRAAIRLLAWIDAQHTTLADLTQTDVDRWLTEQPPESAYPAREFLHWARSRHLTGDVTIPKRRPRHIVTAISDDERWTHLRRCLHDATLPLPARAAGALLLVYGLPVSRISTLHADQITTEGNRILLRLGAHGILLPPAVADLLLAQRDAARTVSVLARSAPPATTWLFPGGFPGRPARDAVYRALRGNGLPHARHARSAALMTLAADLPAPILAALLDLHIATAVAWTQHAAHGRIQAVIATHASPANR